MRKQSRFSTLRELLFFLRHPRLWFRRGLALQDMEQDPFDQFQKWFSCAQHVWFLEFPNAMVLSTLSPSGDLEGRVVLLKSFDSQGFVFYTNTLSAKGKALAAQPKCALTFYWDALQWQVRVQGSVEPVSTEEADAYFASRPRASQIGAWASRQSSACQEGELLKEVRKYEEQFRAAEVPRPAHWSGYRVKPASFEFWELRLSRLHDRFRYEQQSDGTWLRKKLFP
jgi:pyridoxamine 5'-phosphate oxidase